MLHFAPLQQDAKFIRTELPDCSCSSPALPPACPFGQRPPAPPSCADRDLDLSFCGTGDGAISCCSSCGADDGADGAGPALLDDLRRLQLLPAAVSSADSLTPARYFGFTTTGMNATRWR
uniref:Uncharacterized protein n=1 Tax=Anopheles melas TaxID=34690 RepID=A0A182TRQ9_9DIPT